MKEAKKKWRRNCYYCKKTFITKYKNGKVCEECKIKIRKEANKKIKNKMIENKKRQAIDLRSYRKIKENKKLHYYY